jgi:stage IV sporulation protein B
VTKLNKKIILFSILSLFILFISFLSFNLYIKEAYSQPKIEKTYLVPLGGISGISARTEGVLIIGIEEEAKSNLGVIKVGDVITSIEGIKVSNEADISKILKDNKKDVISITIKRNEKYKNIEFELFKDKKDYKMGLWIRDKISGIGTLTYYNPITKEFAALGHGITDIDSKTLIKVDQGDLYLPTKINIVKGNLKKTGEVIGEFDTQHSIGKFKLNNIFGIRGTLNDVSNFNLPKALEVGHYYEVKTGPAKILFQDKHGDIKSYDIKIDKIYNHNTPQDKSMVIEIVDKDLINYTGGIVQGMSGSPIIQKNKIVGAVTHVFIDNPKKGYGIFIDWMIK